MIQEISHDSLFSRRKAKTRSSLLAQSVGTDLKPLLPPEVKAVEKETLKKKVCLTLLDLPPLHLHLHFIQFQVNPRCCHVILWCLYFFFLSRNFDWLPASYLLMKRNQFSFWFLVSNKSETRPIRWAPKLQLRHRFQRGPANKTWVPLQHFQINLLRSYIEQIDAGYRNS